MSKCSGFCQCDECLDRRYERSHGGKRAGAGRPKKQSSEAGVTVSAYLSVEDLEYLRSWGDSNSLAIRRMLDRCRLMWPKGE